MVDHHIHRNGGSGSAEEDKRGGNELDDEEVLSYLPISFNNDVLDVLDKGDTL